MITIYTQEDSERFHDYANYLSNFLLYNGSINSDDEPADYIYQNKTLKGVRVA